MNKKHRQNISKGMKAAWQRKKATQPSLPSVAPATSVYESSIQASAVSTLQNGVLENPKTSNKVTISLASQRDLAQRHYVNLNPETVRFVLDSTEQGLLESWSDFCDSILDTDPHIKGLIEKRKNAISVKEMKVIPFSTSPRDLFVAEFVKDVLDNIYDFSRSLRHLQLGIFTGFSAAEIIYSKKKLKMKNVVTDNGTDNGREEDSRKEDSREEDGNRREVPVFIPSTIQPILNRRFQIKEVDGRWRYLLDDYGTYPLDEDNPAIKLPEKFVLHSPGNEVLPHKRGLLRQLAFNYLNRKIALTYYLAGAEKHAFPSTYASVPNSTELEARMKLLNSLKLMSNDGVGVFDDAVSLKVLEGSAKDGAESWRGLLSFLDTEATKLIIQGTLVVEAASGPGGNRALGEVHERSFEEVVIGDALALSDTIKFQVIKSILEVNSHLFGGQVPPLPSIEFKLKVREPEKLQQFHVQAGAVKINEIRERAGLDPIAGGEAIATWSTGETIKEELSSNDDDTGDTEVPV